MLHPLEKYNYNIDEKNIRREPLLKRDDSRLFVYDTQKDEIVFDYFYNLSKYLPENSLVVLNNTGVIPARVTFKKDTGGKVSGLVLVNEGFDKDGAIPIIVGEQIFPERKLSLLNDYWFTITRQDEQRFYIKPEFDKNLLPEILEKCGITPTPYYLGKINLEENELRSRYQTIFSKEKKSVAAPTASLHFTNEVFASLKEKNIEKVEITLDVGLGTFAEVEDKNVKEKKLHLEKFFISKETTNRIREQKENNRSLIAVGTTVTRTLESNALDIFSKTENIIGQTDMFIMNGYEFKIVDHLLTNFHVPKSSLIALVDAFLTHKKSKKNILELYETAKKEGFQFYSFGDSMLIL